MTKLRHISASHTDVSTHVIFVHGLSGDIEKTWTNRRSHSPCFWPAWLGEDVDGIGLWLVGYPATVTNWFGGYSQFLSTHADSILARLLRESDLSQGNIIFIGHSLGGLLVQQILRNADRDAGRDQRTRDFFSRVRGVGFLGTPQRGSRLASVARAIKLIIRPSLATCDLVLDNPFLRDLTIWYRVRSHDNHIENLILAEGRPTRVFNIPLPKVIGTVVPPTNTDIGQHSIPIVVDEDHNGISKPPSRESEVYIHVLDLICRLHSAPPQANLDATHVGEHPRDGRMITAQIKEVAPSASDHGQAIHHKAIHRTQPTIVNDEVTRRLERIRKCRLFRGFDTVDETRRLVSALLVGDLSTANDTVRSHALAWCARLLSRLEPDEAESLLDKIVFPQSELIQIARGCIVAGRGELEESLGKLYEIGTMVARGAAFINVLNGKGFGDAVQWLEEARLEVNDLDSDAKAFYLMAALEQCQWDYAISSTSALGETDFERTPALLLLAAQTCLIQAVPDELRSNALVYLPLPGMALPLGSQPLSLDYRRTAIQFYQRACLVAASFGMEEISEMAGDKALWLRTMDPEEGESARQELKQSLKDPLTFLRRIGLAMHCGVEVNLDRAESEVARHSTLSGGMSHNAAIARLALALSKDDPLESASYIKKHRSQLLRHLDWRGIYAVEIEVLAKAGQIGRAEERLSEAIDRGLTEQEVFRINRMLSELSGGDSVAERLAAYNVTKTVVDLRLLVDALGRDQEWSQVAVYGKRLLDKTDDISDARGYAIALYNLERLNDILTVFETYPTLVDLDNGMGVLRVQTLFELGRIRRARSALRSLRGTHDSVRARQLEIKLALVSGDWEALQGFVEQEWRARESRTAVELLQVGQIAQQIGATRGQELVREAANRAPDDPQVLVGCYNAASVGGWEDHPEVHEWIENAADLSSDNGPVRRMTVADLLEMTPGWSQRESKAWDLLSRGGVPNCLAADMLKRPQLSLYLLPALSNIDEQDVRRQTIVYAFSGARPRCEAQTKIIGMDVTALITAEFLGIFEIYVSTFDKIVIPHNTLAWLFDERSRILFHQPSRILDARKLRQMLAAGQIKVLEGSGIVPDNLINDVGTTLASFFTEASSVPRADSRNRRVVISQPVYRSTASVKERVEFDEYGEYICSMADVVRKLVKSGVMTAQDASEASRLLSLYETPSDTGYDIPDDTVLYLDDVVVSHFLRAGLLSKLHRANITPVISQAECEEANGLIGYHMKSEDVISIVERLRVRLREYLDQGKIQLGTAMRSEDDADSGLTVDGPTIAMLKLIDEFDVAVIDDRFVNQHLSMGSDERSRPVLTTLDLLGLLRDRKIISAKEFRNSITKLRLSGFSLIPIDAEELIDLVNSTPASDGVLMETAELRAIRQSVERIRMRDVLQLPLESSWLGSVLQSALMALKEIWKGDTDYDVVRARSEWLLELGDVRGWIHRIREESEDIGRRYGMGVLMLALSPGDSRRSLRKEYWPWLEARLLRPMREENPDIYQFLVEQSREMVTSNVEACLRELEDAHE